MLKYITGILVGLITLNVTAKPLVVPGMPGEDKLMQAVFEEMAERSNRFDGLEHYYRGESDPNTTKMIEDLDSGHMDIMYVATSESNEQNMSPIFFPIYRGLLGMRIGIVRYDKSHQLGGVQSMYQLRQFKACQGKAWPDTDILEANGIKTAKSLNYPNMFPMLEGGRCDYFPRGVFEPFTEVRIHSEYNLVVDDTMVNAQATGLALEQINTVVTSINDMIIMISSACEEQTNVTQLVSQNMTELSAGAGKLRDENVKTEQVVGQLIEIGKQLSDQIQRFKH